MDKSKINQAINALAISAEHRNTLRKAIFQNSELDTNVFEVVETLPTTNIKAKIYCVPNPTGGGTDNKYIEYLYIESTKTWEKVGEFNSNPTTGVTDVTMNGVSIINKTNNTLELSSLASYKYINIGNNNTAKVYGTTIGFGNTYTGGSGDSSVIIGRENTVAGGSQWIVGYRNNIKDYYNSVIGWNNNNKNTQYGYDVLIGTDNVCKGFSVAIGNSNTTTVAGISIGYKNAANANYSFVFGSNAVANNFRELAIGYGNESTNKTIFSVGNGGFVNNTLVRHNLLWGTQDGDLYIVEKTNEDGDGTNYYERTHKRLQSWLNEKANLTGTDTITVNTSKSDDSGLIVQYGKGDTITNTTNITPLGIGISYKSGSIDYNASYTISGMLMSTGTNTAIFNASALQYAVGDKQGVINYADILTSADLVNYAKLDTDNTFTGTNTFKSNVISQEFSTTGLNWENAGYICAISADTAKAAAMFNPIKSYMVFADSEESFVTRIDVDLSENKTPIITMEDSDNKATIATTGIRFSSTKNSPQNISLYDGDTELISLVKPTHGNNHYLNINTDSGAFGVRFFSDGIKFNKSGDIGSLNYSDIATKVTSTTSSDSAITLKPNANVDVTPTAATTITIAKPTDTTIVNIYSCTINTKTSSEVTIALADTTATITWDDTPSFEAGKIYEISVRYTPSGYFGLIHSWSL